METSVMLVKTCAKNVNHVDLDTTKGDCLDYEVTIGGAGGTFLMLDKANNAVMSDGGQGGPNVFRRRWPDPTLGDVIPPPNADETHRLFMAYPFAFQYRWTITLIPGDAAIPPTVIKDCTYQNPSATDWDNDRIRIST
jgi:hypothetical protein